VRTALHGVGMKRHFLLLVLLNGCFGEVSIGTVKPGGGSSSSSSSSSSGSSGTPQQCGTGAEVVVFTAGQDNTPSGGTVADLTVVNGTVYFTYNWVANATTSGVVRIRPGAKPELASDYISTLRRLSVLGDIAYVTREPFTAQKTPTIRLLHFGNPGGTPRDIDTSFPYLHDARDGYFYYFSQVSEGSRLLYRENAMSAEQVVTFGTADIPKGFTTAGGMPVIAAGDGSALSPTTRLLVPAAALPDGPPPARELANLGNGSFVSTLAGDDDAVYGVYEGGNLLRVSVKKSPSTPSVLATIPNLSDATIAVDDAYVYIAGDTCHLCTHGVSGIVRTPKTGGAVQQIVNDPNGLHYASSLGRRPFAIDACDFYWVAPDNSVHRKPKSSL
jgi:hypothetical protein